MILFVFFSILSTIYGQLGPNYDPLFYDVMLYFVIGIIFLIIIIVVIVTTVLVIRKKRKNKQYQQSLGDSSDDSSDEKGWNGI